MMRAQIGFIGLLFCILLTTGCVQNHGTFTVLSNKGVDVSKVDLAAGPRTKDVEGRSVSHRVLIFFPIGPGSSSGVALNEALAKGQGEVMADVALKSWRWSIIIYSQSGWSVRGDVLRSDGP